MSIEREKKKKKERKRNVSELEKEIIPWKVKNRMSIALCVIISEGEKSFIVHSPSLLLRILNFIQREKERKK